MTSIKYLETQLSTWLATHPAKPKYFFEFTEQMPNLATISEIYPLVFFAYEGMQPFTNVVNYTFTVYVVDLIRDKRDNLNDIMSETNLIMNDIYMHYQNSDDSIDTVGGIFATPLPNFDLDYVAGWQASITFEVPQICDNLV